jgi:cellulose synthase/poly-beta-1,6-N-acetylglucosamine synthase-like glycosyltransferase
MLFTDSSWCGPQMHITQGFKAMENTSNDAAIPGHLVRYVLVTPAHNEEKFIRKTLDSMAAQTLLPERWVIVDDGSTDKTAEIVESYTQRYPWIELVRRPEQSAQFCR